MVEFLMSEFDKRSNINPIERNKQLIELVKKNYGVEITGDTIYDRCIRVRKRTIKNDHVLHKQKTQESDTNRKYKKLLSQIDSYESAIETLSEVKNTKPTVHTISANGHEKSEATAILVASDWHIEEVVDPDTLNNLNEYNPDIATERAKKFFNNGLKLTDMMAKDVKIDRIVIAMLGDFISGYIHEELSEGNAMSPTQALILFRDIMISGIKHILTNSKYNLTLVCKFGNHGRTTDKIRVSTGYKNSFEWLIYHMIASEFKDDDRVEFIIENGYQTYFRIYDTMLRFHHGDAFKYGGGVGGITIPVKKSIAQWNKAKHADIDVFGHFHQLIFANEFVCNGSLIGYNNYAERIKAEYEKPRQAFFLIDSEHGKTIQCPIFVS